MAARTSALALRWTAVALLGAGGLFFVGHSVRRPEVVSPPAEVKVAAPDLPASAAPRSEEAEAVPMPATIPAEPSASPKARPQPTSRPSSLAAPLAPSGSLRDEIALLDAARRALGSGDTRLALATLDRHQTEFPRGLLGQETTLLRIEVLARGGNRPAAEALARQFLARHPDSPHAKRIESLLGPSTAQAPRR
jgi:hypothetical protein